jgi:general secretion pathway protein B
MSYILDALRRADAERERGAVPGLHAQPVPANAASGDAPRVPRTALWVALGVLGGLLVAAAWRLAGDDAPAPVAATAPAAVAPAPAPRIAATPAAPSTIAPPSPPRAAEQRPTAAPRSATAPPVRRAAAPASTPVDAAAAPDRIVGLQDLPADVRRELPALKLGGSIYSEDPRSRFLIVNGQTFRESDSLAPGLTLQQIAPKSAVFAYKGWRIEIK